LPNNAPTGRKFIPYPPLYRVIPVGYSGFGYLLPSLRALSYGSGRNGSGSPFFNNFIWLCFFFTTIWLYLESFHKIVPHFLLMDPLVNRQIFNIFLHPFVPISPLSHLCLYGVSVWGVWLMATGCHAADVTRHKNIDVCLVGDSNEAATHTFLQHKPHNRLWRPKTTPPPQLAAL
jgi:hypothetical protein